MKPPSDLFPRTEPEPAPASRFRLASYGSALAFQTPLQLGSYPTPVQHLASLSEPGCELWIKRDDLTHPQCGGNKVRKLERLLARARGARRLVTVGAVGSHHVLATTFFGRRLQFEVEAVLFPQPFTEHALEVVRAGIALGLKPFCVSSVARVPPAVLGRLASGSRWIPPGGSNVEGAMGYVDAARELAAQVRAGALPEPDVCVVALGSGGTAAGLAAGFAAENLKTQVIGVCVVKPAWLVRLAARALARACARRLGVRLEALKPRPGPRPRPGDDSTLRPRLATDERFLGAGYGYESSQGREALRLAEAKASIALDPTYTAKAFAAALSLVRERPRPDAPRAKCVLYWHTLSSAPLAPLIAGAAGADVGTSAGRGGPGGCGGGGQDPDGDGMGRAVRALLRPSRS